MFVAVTVAILDEVTRRVVISVVVSVAVCVDVPVTVSDFGNEYWYTFKARETTTTTSRTAAAALHLIGTASFCAWAGTYISSTSENVGP